MKKSNRFIKSKIGRRIFFMFAICALLPITLLGGVSYYQVSKELQKQNRDFLFKEAKAIGLSIYERLIFLENELNILALTLSNKDRDVPVFEGLMVSSRIIQRFKSVGIVNKRGDAHVVSGKWKSFRPEMTDEEKQHMESGRTLLCVNTNATDTPDIFLMQRVTDSVQTERHLLAEIHPDYLWGENIKGSFGSQTQVMIFCHNGQLLFSSTDWPEAVNSRIKEYIFKGAKVVLIYRTIMKPMLLFTAWFLPSSGFSLKVIRLSCSDLRRLYYSLLLIFTVFYR